MQALRPIQSLFPAGRSSSSASEGGATDPCIYLLFARIKTLVKKKGNFG